MTTENQTAAGAESNSDKPAGSGVDDRRLVRLTAAQEDLLDAMKCGTRVHLMLGRGEGYCFRADTMKRCTKQVDGLLAKGFIEEYDRDWRGAKYRIVEANVKTEAIPVTAPRKPRASKQLPKLAARTQQSR